MLSTRRMFLAIAAAAIVALAIGISAWRSHVRDFQRQQALRDAVYAAAVEGFQHDLKIGTQRAQVKQFLESRRMQYEEVYFGSSGATGWSYTVNVGREPSNTLWCDYWNVYVALNFNA